MTEDPSRPVLRPGLRLVRRCDGYLQAGLSRPLRAGLPDSLTARRLGLSLRRWDRPSPPESESLLRDLAGLLVDGPALRGLLQEQPAHRGAIAALSHRDGDAATERWRRRADTRVRVCGPDRWRSLAESLLRDAGIGSTESEAAAGLHLLVHVGEPPSGRADTLIRTGRPHLWVGSAAGEVVVGPFVDPGRTPCRRCVVAEQSARDPGYALVREQYVGEDGDLPEPEDPLTLTLAVTRAALAVTAWVDGEVPAGWGQTITVESTGRERERRFGRHPECGCSWSGAWLAG